MEISVKRNLSYSVMHTTMQLDLVALVAKSKAIRKMRSSAGYRNSITNSSSVDFLYATKQTLRDKLRAITLLRALINGKKYSDVENPTNTDMRLLHYYVIPQIASYYQHVCSKSIKACTIDGKESTLGILVTIKYWTEGSKIEFTYY